MFISRKITQLTAIIVAFAFAASDLAWAAPEIARQASLKPAGLADVVREPSLLDVPLQHAILKEFHRGTNGKLLIHIQDAHSNLSGQQNLAATLDSLMRTHGIPLVLVEGGDRDVTLDEVKKVASKEDWKIVATRFLNDGMISGDEYLNLTSDYPMKLWGLEYPELYKQNVESYARLAERRKEILVYLHRIQTSLDRVKAKLYPAELIAYERLKAKPLAAQSSLNTLLELSAKSGIALDKYAALTKLKTIQAQEKAIDFNLASMEQIKLESKEATIETLGELKKYRAYLKAFGELDLAATVTESDALENEVYQASLKAEDAQKIRAIDRFVSLLDKAYRVQMSSDEFEMLGVNEPVFATVSWQAFLNQKLTDLGYIENMVPYKTLLDDARADLKEFYSLVDQRDLAFFENAKRVMGEQNQNAAFLVAGGYHTNHLTKLFREEGYSYAVLAPIITFETDYDKYEKILLSSLKKTSVATLRAAELVTEQGVDRLSKSSGAYASLGARVPFNKMVSALKNSLSRRAPNSPESTAPAPSSGDATTAVEVNIDAGARVQRTVQNPNPDSNVKTITVDLPGGTAPPDKTGTLYVFDDEDASKLAGSLKGWPENLNLKITLTSGRLEVYFSDETGKNTFKGVINLVDQATVRLGIGGKDIDFIPADWTQKAFDEAIGRAIQNWFAEALYPWLTERGFKTFYATVSGDAIDQRERAATFFARIGLTPDDIAKQHEAHHRWSRPLGSREPTEPEDEDVLKYYRSPQVPLDDPALKRRPYLLTVAAKTLWKAFVLETLLRRESVRYSRYEAAFAMQWIHYNFVRSKVKESVEEVRKLIQTGTYVGVPAPKVDEKLVRQLLAATMTVVLSNRYQTPIDLEPLFKIADVTSHIFKDRPFEEFPSITDNLPGKRIGLGSIPLIEIHKPRDSNVYTLSQQQPALDAKVLARVPRVISQFVWNSPPAGSRIASLIERHRELNRKSPEERRKRSEELLEFARKLIIAIQKDPLLKDKVRPKPEKDILSSAGSVIRVNFLGRGGYSAVFADLHSDITMKQSRTPARDHSVEYHPALVEARAYARLENGTRELRRLSRNLHVPKLKEIAVTRTGKIRLYKRSIPDAEDLDSPRWQSLSLRERLDTLLKAAKTVKTFHDNGLVHQDLKPGNIVRNGQGRVMLLDLGLLQPEGSDHTNGTKLFTPDGFIPDIAEARNDVFAFGVTMRLWLQGVFYQGEAVHSNKLVERAELSSEAAGKLARLIDRMAPIHRIKSEELGPKPTEISGLQGERPPLEPVSMDEVAGVLKDALSEFPQKGMSWSGLLRAITPRNFQTAGSRVVVAPSQSVSIQIEWNNPGKITLGELELNVSLTDSNQQRRFPGSVQLAFGNQVLGLRAGEYWAVQRVGEDDPDFISFISDKSDVPVELASPGFGGITGEGISPEKAVIISLEPSGVLTVMNHDDDPERFPVVVAGKVLGPAPADAMRLLLVETRILRSLTAHGLNTPAAWDKYEASLTDSRLLSVGDAFTIGMIVDREMEGLSTEDRSLLHGRIRDSLGSRRTGVRPEWRSVERELIKASNALQAAMAVVDHRYLKVQGDPEAFLMMLLDAKRAQDFDREGILLATDDRKREMRDSLMIDLTPTFMELGEWIVRLRRGEEPDQLEMLERLQMHIRALDTTKDAAHGHVRNLIGRIQFRANVGLTQKRLLAAFNSALDVAGARTAVYRSPDYGTEDFRDFSTEEAVLKLFEALKQDPSAEGSKKIKTLFERFFTEIVGNTRTALSHGAVTKDGGLKYWITIDRSPVEVVMTISSNVLPSAEQEASIRRKLAMDSSTLEERVVLSIQALVDGDAEAKFRESGGMGVGIELLRVSAAENYPSAELSYSRTGDGQTFSLHMPVAGARTKKLGKWSQADIDTMVAEGVSYEEARLWRRYRKQRLIRKFPNGFWDKPETAVNMALVALDTLPGFKRARLAKNVKTMAAIYRRRVKNYKRSNGKQGGQAFFFYDVGEMKGLFVHKRDFLRKTGNPAALVELAFKDTGLIDENNPDALKPHEVENDWWNDEDYARRQVLRALDKAGLTPAIQSRNIKLFAVLYRERVIRYQREVKTSMKDQGQFIFFKDQDLGGLMSAPRKFLKKTDSPAALLNFALSDLKVIDENNPDALKPHEVEDDWWNDKGYAKRQIIRALDSIKGFKEARLARKVSVMAQLYRDHVMTFPDNSGHRMGSQRAFFLAQGLGTLMNYPRPFLKSSSSVSNLIKFALPALVNPRNPGALTVTELGITGSRAAQIIHYVLDQLDGQMPLNERDALTMRRKIDELLVIAEDVEIAESIIRQKFINNETQRLLHMTALACLIYLDDLDLSVFKKLERVIAQYNGTMPQLFNRQRSAPLSLRLLFVLNFAAVFPDKTALYRRIFELNSRLTQLPGKYAILAVAWDLCSSGIHNRTGLDDFDAATTLALFLFALIKLLAKHIPKNSLNILTSAVPRPGRKSIICEKQI